jgi:hypothetical protein
LSQLNTSNWIRDVLALVILDVGILNMELDNDSLDIVGVELRAQKIHYFLVGTKTPMTTKKTRGDDSRQTKLGSMLTR